MEQIKYIRVFLCARETNKQNSYRDQWELSLKLSLPVLTFCRYNNQINEGVYNILNDKNAKLAIHIPYQKTGTYKNMNGCLGIAILDKKRLNDKRFEWIPEAKHRSMILHENKCIYKKNYTYLPIKFIKKFDVPQKKDGNNSSGINTIQYVKNNEWIDFYNKL
jgi:hypothetical protein